MLSPDWREWFGAFRQCAQRLEQLLQDRLQRANQHVDWLQRTPGTPTTTDRTSPATIARPEPAFATGAGGSATAGARTADGTGRAASSVVSGAAPGGRWRSNANICASASRAVCATRWRPPMSVCGTWPADTARLSPLATLDLAMPSCASGLTAAPVIREARAVKAGEHVRATGAPRAGSTAAWRTRMKNSGFVRVAWFAVTPRGADTSE